jgi:group I intron endonuclease
MTGIYKITSPTGKVYIGQSVNIHQRKLNYKNFISNNGNIGPKLFNSLKKYGWEQHIFEVVEECLVDQLNEREIYWGKYYNTLLEGLNCKLGEGRGACSEETKQKMSKAHLGNKKRVGCIMSEEAKQSIGLKNSKPKPKVFSEKKSKPIIQYDLEGNFIREWNSIIEAQKRYGNSIISNLRGNTETAYGYKWKYKL